MDWTSGRVLAVLGAMTLTAAGCGENGAKAPVVAGEKKASVVFEGENYKILEPEGSRAAVMNLNAHKMTTTVCDPFGTSGPPKLKNGITAELYWLDSQCPRYEKVEELVSHAVKSEKKLFFTDLHTPTRLFERGFSTQTSETLKDDQGATLIEWFGLKFSSGLRLPDGLEDGAYELAMLSDDGTILRVKSGEDWSELINNDGVHPTRMGCAKRFVNLSKESVLDFQLFYAQGPRFHISNVLMWRPIAKTPGQAGKDKSCGVEGNEHYFDPTKNSEPQKAYKDLLARGWSPVPAEAFVIPDGEGYNPCHEGTPATVSDFRVLERTLTDAVVAWTTDLPATTQLRWRNVDTGGVTVSESDNRLRTSHSMWLTGLTPGVTYAVEVLATTEDNGRTVAGPFMITVGEE